ncbi:MAG: PASTA domain-containing protein [Acidimicrobiales bacterium]
MSHPDPQTVVVPQLIGLPVGEARSLADAAELILTSGAPDGPPLGSLTLTGYWVVTEQRPPAGTAVEPASLVVIDFEDGGGGEAGDREPRTPRPPTRLLTAECNEPARGSS